MSKEESISFCCKSGRACNFKPVVTASRSGTLFKISGEPPKHVVDNWKKMGLSYNNKTLYCLHEVLGVKEGILVHATERKKICGKMEDVPLYDCPDLDSFFWNKCLFCEHKHYWEQEQEQKEKKIQKVVQ